MTPSLGRIVAGLAVGYLAYGALSFFAQRSLIFPGRHMRAPEGGRADSRSLRRTWLETTSGRSEAWLLPAARSTPGPALLFAHGNAELIDDWPELLSGAPRLGTSLLLVEYPGYGRSEGSPSEASIRETMIAAYDWLAAQPEVDRTRIVGFGRSLGGGAVCTLVGQRDLAALVLQSTFTSVRAFARSRWLPGFLVRDPFDNLAALERYPGPVLVMHGDRDDLIPHAHGQALARIAKRGRLVTYRCGHNDCPPSYDAMWRDIGSFLDEHGILATRSEP